RYIINRILLLIPIMLGVSAIIFTLKTFTPGDPARQILGNNATEEQVDAKREELGLNDPVLVQYVRYVAGVCHGDFGISTSSHTQVWPLIKAKMPATIGLMAASIIFSLVVAIPLGMLAGCFENSKFDRIANAFHYVAISVPSFWLAIMMIIVFSLKLHWLPSSGMRTTGVNSIFDIIAHGIMPVIVLSAGKISVYARYVRAATIQQLSEDYVLFAISKGASKVYILFRHVMKNCLLPIITLVGMNMGSLVSGSYIVETIFGWPGLGTTGMSAIYSRDYNMIMGTTMLSCFLLVFGNLLADLCYSFADPRIKAMRGEKR
ncbi:MAG: ABC transporter permease, partial [Clostridia bacterium]|nr:ABC transporter permease [Clostridia bacterium]